MAYLDDVYSKISYSLTAAHHYRGIGNDLGKPVLFIAFHGFANAFYSIREQLIKKEKNRPDLAFKAAISQAFDENADKQYRNYLDILMRNPLTHQGVFNSTSILEWVPNDFHDTVFPEQRISVSLEDGPVDVDTYFDTVCSAFVWWQKRMDDICDAYVNAGGRREVVNQSSINVDDNSAFDIL
ncbi:hypothetical protein [Agrobacterium larrymoorei]|uniref:Uncharacterized protein n=1 Tax=Agrobacterium larrymoorei TaxID=160699 RepID=A0AAF0HAX9_9HYPH|nr:hypothetical protein [Agrobacterium larrymoorei]WHA40998.1 hypothetical protein CFBP5477_014520 [Agrobacterium larrymoorei]